MAKERLTRTTTSRRAPVKVAAPPTAAKMIPTKSARRTPKAKPIVRHRKSSPASPAHSLLETKRTPGPDHDQIARAAYRLWLERGGDAESNWLDAERRLISGRD